MILLLQVVKRYRLLVLSYIVCSLTFIGKTTCLVFRMFAQHVSYADKEDTPQLLFLTKNRILCNEVHRAFKNIGLAWQTRNEGDNRAHCDDLNSCARFMTSYDFLNFLESQLPGKRFFSDSKLEQRADDQSQADIVTQEVEDLLSGDSTKAK